MKTVAPYLTLVVNQQPRKEPTRDHLAQAGLVDGRASTARLSIFVFPWGQYGIQGAFGGGRHRMQKTEMSTALLIMSMCPRVMGSKVQGYTTTIGRSSQAGDEEPRNSHTFSFPSGRAFGSRPRQ
jgi:hypothetical protein